MSTPAQSYLDLCRDLAGHLASQTGVIAEVAERFARSIRAGGMVHLFGSGHSRMMVEEMWPRYGSFPGFHPIVELSLTHHTGVVGPGGQRQAMYLENVAGLAARILRNYRLGPDDTALVISSSGCNVVPIEMAQELRRQGLVTVGLVSRRHAEASTSRHPDGIKLPDCVDLVLDTGAPAGDAALHVAGLDQPVAPLSTVGGAMVINALKAEIAARLAQTGAPPPVLTASCLVGSERSAELFEAAYDEHARRMARLYAHPEPGETR